ncbi:SagB-type dehydrogenase family enzyme [Methylobacter tundripaludum]|uniref:SagB-type dehydrogenase family enzyme n=2 Tax=Methylobacter tundripaludum TaxID=173365 RepID=A0A2S6H063_9GAMM|nr:SagB-type dehydrogenase family enzyme [Methylobacter tundripaludum]
MKTIIIQYSWLTGLIFSASLAAVQENRPMKLPQPRLETGMPLMQALQGRKSTREFSAEKLPEQVLSDLLWAAFGVNRPETGGRTAPSTSNWQDIDIYIASADGLYLFDAKNHALNMIQAKDIRALTGTQDFVGSAPINLIYVSDFTRMDSDTGAEDKKIAAAIDTGFIAQNVYLYSASMGLATVVRGSIDDEALAKAMSLKSTQWIVAAQSVGYPKK